MLNGAKLRSKIRHTKKPAYNWVMPNLFSELDNCESCPDYDKVTDENEVEIEEHLAAAHIGIGATAFVLAKRPNGERVRLQAVYDQAVNYLDKDFHTRFLRELDELSWELNVFEHLRKSGIKIHPVQHVGPDFDTEIGYIECVCVGQGKGDNKIPLPKVATIDKYGNIEGDFELQEVPVDEMKLRIAGGFYTKQQIYKRYEDRGYIDPTKPRIIALNWHADGASWMSGRGPVENDPATQAIFGFGNRELTIDTATGKVTDNKVAHVPIVTKPSGTLIDVGFFSRKVSNDNPRIDGVILSERWPGPLSLDDTKSVNNPMSDVDLEVEKLTSTKRFRATRNDQNGMIDLAKL